MPYGHAYMDTTVHSLLHCWICQIYQHLYDKTRLWTTFNKTIIFILAHRYNMGRCTIERTKRLNEHLYMLANASRLTRYLSFEQVWSRVLETLVRVGGLLICMKCKVQQSCIHIVWYTGGCKLYTKEVVRRQPGSCWWSSDRGRSREKWWVYDYITK